MLCQSRPAVLGRFGVGPYFHRHIQEKNLLVLLERMNEWNPEVVRAHLENEKRKPIQ